MAPRLPELHLVRALRRQLGRPLDERAPGSLVDGVLAYVCNICGAPGRARLAELGREAPSCTACGSTVRMRAVVHLLSRALFGTSLKLADFPRRPDIHGIGLSDWRIYADGLADKLDYTNTFLDEPPRLDIRCVDPSLFGSLDFLIASDVFEHVAPPVAVAFANARRLLKPGGVCIFSVPFVTEAGCRTQEHFPELHDFVVLDGPSGKRLINTTARGERQEFDSLVFHGGDGLTLEMRCFSEESLVDEFGRAGFREVVFERESELRFGIYWQHPWSVPITARA